jgi:hypothetical protein
MMIFDDDNGGTGGKRFHGKIYQQTQGMPKEESKIIIA